MATKKTNTDGTSRSKPTVKKPVRTRKKVVLDKEKIAAAEQSMARTQNLIETAAGTTNPVGGEIVETRPTTGPEPSTEVAVASPARESVLSIISGVSTADLKAALEVQTEQRGLIKDFIRQNLEVDIDYGKIHVVKNCQAEDRQRGSCDKEYHYSKSILFKPGQEKIFSLFGIQDSLEKDAEAYEMLGNAPGLVAYKCTMYRGKTVIGEGRGAATLSANQNDPNSTIKKAEKRARMDACLSLGFSAYFTQDLDDPEYKSQREMMNEKAAAEADKKDRDEFGLLPRDPKESIDDEERAKLFAMILEAGVHKFYVIDSLKLNGVTDPTQMTSGVARGLMGLIKSEVFKIPQNQVAPAEAEIIPDSQLPEDLYKDKPMVSEAELIVDAEFKQRVMDMYAGLDFNSRGNSWFMKHVTGRPWAKFEQFQKDETWQRAYDYIENITDGRVDVPDDYITGMAEEDQKTVDAIKTVFPGAKEIDIKRGNEDITETP